MNMLIFTAIREDIPQSMGIKKKILTQVNVWKKFNQRVYYCFENADELNLYDEDSSIKEQLQITSKVKFRKRKYNEIFQWIKKYDINVLYVRYDTVDLIALLCFKRCKRLGCKVLLEFPTYPYIGEVKKQNERYLKNREYLTWTVKKIFRLVEKFSVIFAHKYIDYIVTFMYEGKIWGIPVICIDNGIDVDSTPIRVHHKNEKLIFICVANLAVWHGLDRFIEGMKTYKTLSANVMLWIVGSGSEINYMKELTERYGLKKSVFFWGPKTGDELQTLFRKADIGIASLGLHRIGLTLGSTLKAKEYCASSLPFIYAYDEKSLSGNEPFALKFPANDDAIDLLEVVEWADAIKDDETAFTAMRDLAAKYYDWTTILQNVFDKIV